MKTSFRSDASASLLLLQPTWHWWRHAVVMRFNEIVSQCDAQTKSKLNSQNAEQTSDSLRVFSQPRSRNIDLNANKLNKLTATCQPSPTIYWSSTSPPKPRHLTFTSMLFQGEILTFCHLISHQVLGLSAPKYAMPVIWYLCLLYYVEKSCWISSCLVRLLYKHVCVHRVGFQLADTSCIARLICVTFASS